MLWEGISIFKNVYKVEYSYARTLEIRKSGILEIFEGFYKDDLLNGPGKKFNE